MNLNNSNNSRRLLNFRSPKNDIIYLDNKNINNNTINEINTNIFSPTYNKMINEINNKKIILPFKREYSILNNQRNNSISVLRDRDNNNKTISLSKYNADRKDIYLQKSSSKLRNNIFNTNSKHNNLYPLSCKNSKNNGQIVKKYIQKEIIRNGSSTIIKGDSKL